MNALAYPRYDRYKESGVTWLGSVPDSWRVRPCRHEFEIVLGKMLQPDARGADDQEVSYLKALHVQWEKVQGDDLGMMWASPREIERCSVDSGDLLVCEGGEVGRSGIVAALESRPTIIQNALHRVRPRGGNDLRFLMYVMETVAARDWFTVLCNKSTIQHFTGDKFGALRLPLPSPSEQRAIAAFLDRETARIDALIEKQEQLIDKLEEKRKAVIARAVTQGLDPKVRMKESGIPWIGAVPSHWGVEPARHLFKQVDLPPAEGDGVVTAFRDGQVTLRENRRTDGFTVAILEVGYQRVRTGDLVIHSMDAFAGAIGVSDSTGKCTGEYVVCEPLTDGVNNHYYAALLRFMALQKYIYVICPSVR